MTTSLPELNPLDQPIYNVRRQLIISRVVYGLLAFTAVADALTAQSRDQRITAVSTLVCAALGYMLARRSPAWRLVGIPCFIWARYGSPVWPLVVLCGLTIHLWSRDRRAAVSDEKGRDARGVLVTAGVVTGALLYLLLALPARMLRRRLLPHGYQQRKARALLESSDDQQRVTGVRELAAVGGTEAPSLVLSRALQDPSEDVRREAWAALRSMGPRATSVLVAASADRTSPARSSLLSALAETGDPTAVPALVDALADEPLDHRVLALAGLGRIGGAAAQAAIEQALDSSEYGVRSAAVQALVAASRHSGAALRALLAHHEPDVQQLAAEALGEQGDASAVPDLIAAIDRPSLSVRLAAIESLGRLRDPAAVPRLLELLDAPGEEDEDALGLQEVTLRAIGKVGDRRAVDSLQRFVSHPELGWVACEAIDEVTSRVTSGEQPSRA